MASCWDVTQQRCYITQSAGFLARKELKRLVQQLEDVQKMELGVELTLSVQVLSYYNIKYCSKVVLIRSVIVFFIAIIKVWSHNGSCINQMCTRFARGLYEASLHFAAYVSFNNWTTSTGFL